MELSIELIAWIASVFIPLFCFPFIPLYLMPWSCFVLFVIYKQHLDQSEVSCTDRAVYITGCDSGFGHEVAILMDELGFHVFAGCLKPTGEGANFLRAQCSPSLTVLDLDIGNEKSITSAGNIVALECKKRGVELWGLYNNAGISSVGEIEWLSMDHYRRLMDIDMFGAVAVTKSVLPLIRHSKGRIVTITSGLSRMPLSGRSAYSMPKAALESFATCLRYEMRKFGVKCSIIYPGNLVGATKIFSGLSQQLDDSFDALSSEVKEAYGQPYLSAFKRMVVGGYTNISVTSPSSVLNAVRHALVSKHPRIRYKPMSASWYAYDFAMQYLPEQLSDLIIQFNTSLPAVPGRS